MSLATSDEERILKTPPPLSPITASTPSIIASPIATLHIPKSHLTAPQPGVIKKTTTHRVVLKDIPMPRSAPIKSAEAQAIMLKQNYNLYKCPYPVCTFSTNQRLSFQEHLRVHPAFWEKGARIPCVYCNYANTLDHVLIHIDARHGKCCFCCSVCFYRALTRTHVKYHIFHHHPNDNRAIVTNVELNPQAQNVKVPIVLPSLKRLFAGILLECPEEGELEGALGSFWMTFRCSQLVCNKSDFSENQKLRNKV